VLDYLSSSPSEDDGLDEPAECPHDGAGLAGAGLGEAQLGAGAGAGSGAGAAAGGAGLGAAGLGAAGLGAAGLGAAALGAAGAAAGAACFFAERFLALAFLADFFGAAALDFLAAFFADFLAFLADFFAAFFEDFFAVFFFAVTRLFLAFLAFLPFLLFLPLAIVILLLPPIHVYRAFQVVRLRERPIDQLNPGREPPVAQSRSSTVCTTGTDVPPAICTMHPILPAAIMSGLTIAILATFRSRNRFAMSGWRMLYVPAEPQHKWLSGTSFTTNPFLESNSFGA
jgi:hypothetical protein